MGGAAGSDTVDAGTPRTWAIESLLGRMWAVAPAPLLTTTRAYRPREVAPAATSEATALARIAVVAIRTAMRAGARLDG